MSKGSSLKHLAIIMDGNGRWAKSRGLVRSKGHEEGAKNVRTITEYVAKSEIEFLTLYAFSTENWKRPKAEVEALMKLLAKYLKNERDNFLKNDIRFEYIGDINAFSQKLKDELIKTKNATKTCKKLTQILALNYGSRDEITRAVKNLIDENKPINEINISSSLDTAFAGDVDLLIRTGGEYRISNFLSWQCAYAELRFSPTLWPDFSTKELDDIIQTYKKTHRRFGGL